MGIRQAHFQCFVSQVNGMAENLISAQLRWGVVGPCIPALLSTGPRFCLQLGRELDEVGQLLSSQGTVDPLLNRLHDAGFVTSYWEVNDTDRPRRNYRLTDAGGQELVSFQEDWE